MKKRKKEKIQTKEIQRILFFDILRIFFVAAIVYGHSHSELFLWFNGIFFADGYIPFNIYPVGLAGISVYGLIFVSGAVLEYNYKGIERFSEYVKFLFKRFIRLYPAFWMSLIFSIIVCILIFPTVLKTTSLFDFLFEFTGFYVVLGKGPGNLNFMGWFIAAIVSLYFLFPYLSKIVRKYQLTALLLFLIISYTSRTFLFTNNPIPLLYYWFPLCNVFEFCLGIYIVQSRWYPQNAKEHPFIRQLSDLSFYVFLFHWIVLGIFFSISMNNVKLIYICEALGLNLNPYIAFLCDYLIVIGTVILVSWIAMIMDKKIQQTILKNERINNFLRS
ncbi:MAG: acyltransferase family protein [Methanoregula sp.]|nr:acyltransferase family protein [Methanoregula sp.]